MAGFLCALQINYFTVVFFFVPCKSIILLSCFFGAVQIQYFTVMLCFFGAVQIKYFTVVPCFFVAVQIKYFTVCSNVMLGVYCFDILNSGFCC